MRWSKRAAIMITMMMVMIMIGSMESRGNSNRCWVIWIRPARGPCDQDSTQLFGKDKREHQDSILREDCIDVNVMYMYGVAKRALYYII